MWIFGNLFESRSDRLQRQAAQEAENARQRKRLAEQQTAYVKQLRSAPASRPTSTNSLSASSSDDGFLNSPLGLAVGIAAYENMQSSPSGCDVSSSIDSSPSPSCDTSSSSFSSDGGSFGGGGSDSSW